MRELAILFLHFVTTMFRLLGPGGARSIIDRSRQRGPNLRTMDRIFAGLCALLMHPSRVARSAIILKPSTFLGFHRSLVKRKHRLLFSPSTEENLGRRGRQKI